ncbi:LLM class flavin-dependent oxidoreductase [Desertimonas flava]|uniref:LLM class flavin-dependent oxidoreductase n=1 Tax=Desertimonas flava TaxID=2064846 RepID=UPI001968B0B8|nr:LLM class flavin-dependent oxidoreductase [Desertimonas flava]
MTGSARPLRTSLRLNNDLTVAEFVALARRAEAAGFDQIWVSNDLYLRSAPVLLTAAASATERIGLGVGIMNPYSVHPVEIAMMAATLDEASAGRFLLGLGAGAEEFLGWAGLDRPQPVARTRDAVTRIRALLAGEREGTSLDYLRFDASPVPIYLGAMSPRMLAVAGEVADGALPLLFPPEHFPTARAQIVAGAEAAGRDPAGIDVAACIWVSVDDDRDAARAALAEKIAYYGASFAPYLLERAGLSLDDFVPIQLALQEHGIDAARRLVTPQMLRLGIAGTPTDVIERCESLMATGVEHLSFGPPLGADLLAAVDTLGRSVLPAIT